MERDFGYVSRLGSYYWIAGLFYFVHLCVLVWMWLNQGAILFDTCSKRWEWDWWRLYGNAFGLFGVAAAYFLLWHTLATFYYWLTFITCFVIGVWHTVCAILYIGDQTDCSTTFPCADCAPPDHTSAYWIINWVLVAYCAFSCFCECAGVIYLRSRTDFAQTLARVSDSRFNSNVVVATPPGALVTQVNDPNYIPGAMYVNAQLRNGSGNSGAYQPLVPTSNLPAGIAFSEDEVRRPMVPENKKLAFSSGVLTSPTILSKNKNGGSSQQQH